MTQNSSRHSFESYFKRATSPLIVLHLLSLKPMYGYKLMQEMKDVSNGEITMSFLYPVLNKLEEQGYIEVVRKEVESNRIRNYYGVTKAGTEHLIYLKTEYTHMVRATNNILQKEDK